MNLNQIVLYKLGCKEHSDLFDQLLPCVSIEKRERIMQKQSDIDRRLSLYAEVLVRRIACQVLIINNSDIEIVRSKFEIN